MLGIKIRHTFISLYPDTRLSFEMHHPIGLITDAIDQVQGGYSFPVDIPLDDINRGVFGHVDRLDRSGTFVKDEYCEVWAEGVLLHVGKATVRTAGPRRATLFMIFEEIKALGETMLTALDLGGVRNIGADEAAKLALADDTLANPLDHDFIFAPIFNPAYRQLWIDGFPTAQQARFQNFWDGADGGFEHYAVCAITPFVRLDYLLRRIFADAGYTLDNQWQITDELKQLLIYNNYNINSHSAPAIASWDEEINLINHVPYRKSIDLVKAVIGTYALALFMDPRDKTALLVPFKTLITNGVHADWTDRAAADYDHDTDDHFVSRWRYDLDEADAMSVRYSGQPYPQHLVIDTHLVILDVYDEVLVFNGIHYAIADNTYYLIGTSFDVPSGHANYAAQDFKEVRKTGSDKEYISPLIPLWNSHDIETDGDINHDLPLQEQQLAAIEHVGFVKESADAVQVCTSLRLFFYRGMQPYLEGITGTYPMTGVTRYNINGDLVGDYALTWDQPGGVYDAWWKLPYEMLAAKKNVVRTLDLSIRDLINFRFYHKYRIENQNYFITRLRYTLTTRGLGVTEATMITTL
jgi:hypothetical protein